MADLFRYYRPAVAYASVLALVVGAIVALHLLTRPAPPPSVVLITVDSLRADHLGIYGYERDTSPNLDALAPEAVVFDRAYTVETLSGPSHASIFTSLYPVTHGVIYNAYRLDQEALTLAEMLRGAGYRTAAVVSDWLFAEEFGFGQGFDRYQVIQVSSHQSVPKTITAESRPYQLARRWLAGLRGQRFFLWLHCQHPHTSYNPPAPFDLKFAPDIPDDYRYRHYETMREDLARGRLTEEDRRRVVALYDGEIAFTDQMLKLLFDELREHPEPVLVILTADHGDLLFEGAAADRIGHGHGNFYEGAMRVPLVVVPPAGARREPGRVDALVSTVDLLPTIADYAGVTLPDGIEGRSLRPWLEGAPSESRKTVKAMYLKEETRPVLALRDHRFKLIHRAGRDRPHELYDLVEDPGETRNLADARPEQVRASVDRLRAWFGERPDRFPRAQRGLSSEIEALLKQGGYLEEDDD